MIKALSRSLEIIIEDPHWLLMSSVIHRAFLFANVVNFLGMVRYCWNDLIHYVSHFCHTLFGSCFQISVNCRWTPSTALIFKYTHYRNQRCTFRWGETSVFLILPHGLVMLRPVLQALWACFNIQKRNYFFVWHAEDEVYIIIDIKFTNSVGIFGYFSVLVS